MVKVEKVKRRGGKDEQKFSLAHCLPATGASKHIRHTSTMYILLCILYKYYHLPICNVACN